MYWRAVVGVLLVACSSSGDDAPLPACAPFDIMVQPVQHLGRPIWTGSEYLVLTQNSPGVIQRIAADGMLGPTIALGVDVDVYGRPIAWSGSELGVVYSVPSGSAKAFKLARFTLDGTKVGDTMVADNVPDLLDNRTLIWAGDRYLFGWGEMGMPGTVRIEEISADGVAGTPHSVAGKGNQVFALASTSTTHLAIIDTYGPSSDLGSYVVIDRASDTATVHPISVALRSQALQVHGSDFVEYAAINTGPPSLYTVTAGGMETTSLPAPDLGGADMITTPHGYHLLGINPNNSAGGYFVDDVDIAEDGTQGAITMRGTIPSGVSTDYPALVRRGNGQLTAWASGPNLQLTARLIQDCDP